MNIFLLKIIIIHKSNQIKKISKIILIINKNKLNSYYIIHKKKK